jgi:hypothetical protein
LVNYQPFHKEYWKEEERRIPSIKDIGKKKREGLVNNKALP